MLSRRHCAAPHPQEEVRAAGRGPEEPVRGDGNIQVCIKINEVKSLRCAVGYEFGEQNSPHQPVHGEVAHVICQGDTISMLSKQGK